MVAQLNCTVTFGNSAGKRFDAYSAEQVLLNKQQIWCGEAYLHRYLAFFFNQMNTAGELPRQHLTKYPTGPATRR